MNSNNDYSTLITGLLCLMLVAFKLLGVINWSWWLVLLPFFIGPAALPVVPGHDHLVPHGERQEHAGGCRDRAAG